MRTCASLFQHLWNGSTDCAEIWFAVSDPVSWDLAEAKGFTMFRKIVRLPLGQLNGSADTSLSNDENESMF